MTLSIGTMMTACRERAIGEIDPVLPKDFVGFWYRDIVLGSYSYISRWNAHAPYSNDDRMLLGFSRGSEKLPVYANSSWIAMSDSHGNTNSGFILATKADDPVYSPTLTMTRANQTKLYLRFNYWLYSGNTPRTIFQTSWGEGDSVVGLAVETSSTYVKVTWKTSDVELGDQTISLDTTGVSSIWTWLRIFIEKGNKIVVELWDYEMTKKLKTIEAPFTDLLVAPEDAKHYVFWGGPEVDTKSSGFYRDFGYGSDFNMPPEPKVASTDSPEA